MQIPEWVKPAVWGGVVGVIGVTIIAFSAGWIVTAGTADEMAERKADKAAIAALTPVCVAQFKSVPNPKEAKHLAALEDESSWSRSDYVEEQGWATMPGSEEPNEEVAEACADKLMQLAQK